MNKELSLERELIDRLNDQNKSKEQREQEFKDSIKVELWKAIAEGFKNKR